MKHAAEGLVNDLDLHLGKHDPCKALLGLFLLSRTIAALGDDGFMAFHHDLKGTNLTLSFDLGANNSSYYILDQGTNLAQFTAMQMSFGGGSNLWGFTVSPEISEAKFWRVRRVPATLPLDTDGDGMDDLFELTHRLNPVNPGDASLASDLVDDNNNSLTWLEAYHYFFQQHRKLFDAVSREISSFNFGQPTANYEAVSREYSVFNAPSPDSNQDGIDDAYAANHGIAGNSANLPSGFTEDFPNNLSKSLTWLELYRLNFGQNRILYDTVGREVSVFNFGQPTANFETISREVSVFNVPMPDADGDGLDDVYGLNHGLAAGGANQLSGFTDDFPNNLGNSLTWLEIYHMNFGQNRILYDTASREISVFNFGQATANYEAIAREVSIFNFGQLTANYEAVSREVSVFNTP